MAACTAVQQEGDVILTGTNPIIKGQFTADPTARVFEGKIYMYPSHDIPSVITHHDGSAWFSMPDYHVFSSEDLTSWTDHGVILRQEDVPWESPMPMRCGLLTASIRTVSIISISLMLRLRDLVSV